MSGDNLQEYLTQVGILLPDESIKNRRSGMATYVFLFFAIAEGYNLQQRINSIDYPREALRKRATQETGKSRGLFINEV